MFDHLPRRSKLGWLTLLSCLLMALVSCTVPNPSVAPSTTDEPATGAAPFRVVATTNILGDIVHQVGGDWIQLVTLLPVGADPHSYSATPADLRALSEAHLIFVVGAGIEESLLGVLENREGDSRLVAVNDSLALAALGEEDAHEHEHHADEHHHHGVDPHTWTSVANVIEWVETIADALATQDPANAASYASNAAAYTEALAILDQEIRAQVVTIPPAQRLLVTDHETFGYFARDYGFTVVGSVIPSFSTAAASSAQEVAALQRQISETGAPAIFVGSTVAPTLADQLASDLGIQVVPLYADSLSDAAGPAATYLAMMRYNSNAITTALQPQ